MRTLLKVLAWVCTVLAAMTIVGGAYLFGVNAGLFADGRADDVGRRLLEDRVFQRTLSERAVEELVQEAPALEPVRGALVEAAVEATATRAYRALFQDVVDAAYLKVARSAFGDPVVLTLEDLAALLARRESVIARLPVGSLRDEQVVLLEGEDIVQLRKARVQADRWALPLLAGGSVLAIVAIALPGRKGPRLVLLGAGIALGSALLMFANEIAGSEFAARSPESAGAVIAALWRSAAMSVRLWLGGTFLVGALIDRHRLPHRDRGRGRRGTAGHRRPSHIVSPRSSSGTRSANSQAVQ